MSQNKGRPIFGLKKIADTDLLQLTKQEIGKLRSYIDELEYDKSVLENRVRMLTQLTPEELAAVRGEIYARKVIKERNRKVKQLEKKLSQRNKDYDDLMYKYCQLKQKYEG